MVSTPRWLGLAALVGNIGEYAEAVNISREQMQEPADLFLSQISMKMMKTCHEKMLGNAHNLLACLFAVSLEVKNLK